MKKIYFVLISIVLVSACKPLKQLQVNELKKSPVEILLDSIGKAAPIIETATVKMNVNINYNGRSFSSAATCKIRKDSAMHISLQPVFGVEMFKMEITPKKILIFDKLNQRYYETDFGFIENKIGEGINFQNFQALISNRYFSIISTDSVSASCVARGNIVECSNNKVLQQTETGIDYRIQKINLLYQKTDRKMETQYSGFAPADGIIFPYKIYLQASKPGMQVKVEFNCNKISFQNKPVFNTTDISQFTKSDIKQLMTK